LSSNHQHHHHTSTSSGRNIPQTMALSLPREVTEFILDELGVDLPSLRACALVHSSWTLASQARIFHTVAVHSEEQWDALIELLRASSHIRPLLRRLEACDEFSVSSAEPSPMLFPRVEHLTYSRPPLEDMMLRIFPSLITLELSNCLWYYADNALCQRIASGYSPEKGGVLVLRSLILIDVCEFPDWSSLAEWTRISVQWQSLRSLAITVPKPEDGPAHQQMFEVITALETLTLDCKYRRSDGIGWCSINAFREITTYLSMQPWILAQSLCLGCTSGWTMRYSCPRCLLFFARRLFHGCGISTSRSLDHLPGTLSMVRLTPCGTSTSHVSSKT
jgi:hypothetical protein